jgi:hypothetical protein
VAGGGDSEAAAGADYATRAICATVLRLWIVSGANGENRIEARGASQDTAWRNAVLQADAVGMAGQSRGG